MRRSLGCTARGCRGFYVSVKAGLPPIARTDAKLFVLGSLPGDASLTAQRYYAHPTNQFWRLLGAAINENLILLSYEDRLARLADRCIGLWDVIASAARRGSLDQSIREAEPNQIERLLEEYTGLRAIAFNGAKAARVGRKLIGEPPERISLIDLPSSSAANTKTFAEKAADWAKLGEFVQP